MTDASVVPLSQLNDTQTRASFRAADVEVAIQLLVDGIVGTRDTPELLERIRSAAIRLSGGSLDRLLDAIVLAQQDWRDLLVAAEFANDVHAHARWMP